MHLSSFNVNKTFLCQTLSFPFLLFLRVRVDAGQTYESVIMITAILTEKSEFEFPCVLLFLPSSYL